MFMAITATVTAPRVKLLGAVSLLISAGSIGAELTITPTVSVGETYSDNVLATAIDKQSSFVTDTKASLRAEIMSKAFEFNVSGSASRLFYTHDHSLDENYNTLSARGLFSPFTSGPKLQFNAVIDNVARNTADNLYADLINGNSVESQNFSVGLIQEINNSDFVLDASINAYSTKYDDDIGESDGYRSALSFSNGSGIKTIFWDISGAYNDRDNAGQTGRDHQVEVKFGFNTPIKLSPFYRYYDEDFSGSIANSASNTATSSSGAGIRWKIAQHFNIDVSYNFVQDDELTDDYVEAAINWQPSERTSIVAQYNQRFFGDSYNIQISHRTRRLTNTFSYVEQLEAFERDNFETFVRETLFCPIGQPFEQENCLLTDENIDDLSQFFQLEQLGLRPVEDNQFSINKSYTWNSELKLSRTTFTLNVSGNERENLNRGNIDKYFNTSLTAKRRMSGRSNLSVSWRFNETNFNTTNIGDALSQKDYYRTINATYDRKMNNTITADIGVEYRNRSSDRNNRDYEETRIMLTIKKDF